MQNIEIRKEGGLIGIVTKLFTFVAMLTYRRDIRKTKPLQFQFSATCEKNYRMYN